VIASHYYRKCTASQRFFDRRGRVEARLPDGGHVARLTRTAQIALIGVRHGDVAAVTNRTAESLELLENAGCAERARAQAYAAPSCADVDGNADHVDAPAGNSGHSETLAFRMMMRTPALLS
jgi:hypothetical protein